MNVMKFAELVSSGALLTSVFHQLLAGNSGNGTGIAPPSVAANDKLATIERMTASRIHRGTASFCSPGCAAGCEASHNEDRLNLRSSATSADSPQALTFGFRQTTGSAASNVFKCASNLARTSDGAPEESRSRSSQARRSWSALVAWLSAKRSASSRSGIAGHPQMSQMFAD